MVEIVGGIIVLLILVIMSGVKVVNEYDRLVVFRLGKCTGIRNPGVQLVLPLVERCQVVDTRIATLPIPTLETTTLDNHSVKLSAVCMYQIVDPQRAVTKIVDVTQATTEIAQSTLRGVVSQHDLRHLLADRKRVNAVLKGRLEKQTREWGVKIISLEIKDIKITRDVKRSIARSRTNDERMNRPEPAFQVSAPGFAYAQAEFAIPEFAIPKFDLLSSMHVDQSFSAFSASAASDEDETVEQIEEDFSVESLPEQRPEAQSQAN